KIDQSHHRGGADFRKIVWIETEVQPPSRGGDVEPAFEEHMVLRVNADQVREPARHFDGSRYGGRAGVPLGSNDDHAKWDLSLVAEALDLLQIAAEIEVRNARIEIEMEEG